jgi:hypothetical protein
MVVPGFKGTGSARKGLPIFLNERQSDRNIYIRLRTGETGQFRLPGPLCGGTVQYFFLKAGFTEKRIKFSRLFRNHSCAFSTNIQIAKIAKYV